MNISSKELSMSFNNNIDTISSLREQELTIDSCLKKNGFVMSTIVGVSMLPTLRQNSDRVIIEVPKELLKKYDIALYKRQDGKYVLHRVIAVGNDSYVIRGDNTYIEECVSFENVKGVVTHFVRRGKMVDVMDKKYLNYVRLLYRLYPIRKLIWRCRVAGSKMKRKIRQEE